MTWIGPEKSKADVIAHWRKVLANPNAHATAHWIAAQALRDLRADEQPPPADAAQTAPITQADPTRGVDERS